MGDSRVLYLGLSDIESLVSQVVINRHFPDSVVLESAFDDMLLEISIEPENLPIVLEPWRLNSGNVVIFGCLSLPQEGQLTHAFGHLINQVHVDLLFDILLFLLNTSSNKVELLSLVIALLIRVTEYVTG